MGKKVETKISEHFSLEEFLASDIAKQHKIDNTPTETHKRIIIHTAQYFCEPLSKLLCNKYGETSINITSGYRSAKLNAKVGGVSTSQHCKGEAIDFKVKQKSSKKYLDYAKIYEDIKYWVGMGKLSVDQCILECSGNTWWVHCSYSSWGSSKNRKEFLKYKNGKYTLDCRL